MDTEFKKNFLLSLLLHAGVLGCFFFLTAFMPQRQLETVVTMEIIGGGGGGGEPTPPAAPLPEPPAPPPAAPPARVEPQPLQQPSPPEPARPTPVEKPADIVIPKTEPPKPKSEPKPAPPKTEPPRKTESPKTETKPVIEKGKLITRQQFNRSAAPPRQVAKNDPYYSPAAIRSRLGKAADSVRVGPSAGGPGSGDGPGSGLGSQYADYYAMLAALLYDAWEIPGTVSPNLTTVVEVNVTRDGALRFVRILRSSGNPAMDESCVAACRRVPRVDPLPAGLGASRNLTITFKPVGP